MIYSIIISSVVLFLLWFFRKRIVKLLLKTKGKLRMGSLRIAISEADGIKEKTDKKAMVVFNNHSDQYEAVSKQLLKKAVKKHKVNRNRKQTKYRQSNVKTITPGRFTLDRIKSLEKKSLYVTN